MSFPARGCWTGSHNSAVKVLNLHCDDRHGFEGWFASEEAFQDQLQRGLVECPVCGATRITKLPSAPRLSLGAATPAPRQEVATAADASMQAQWMKMVRHVMAHTEDVGERFAQEARDIHYGEAQERAIRGQASPDETQALREEGISVMPLAIPKALKETLQ